ncbi:hypothetical protein OPV22_004649 [Ensete ventricosum]|uniref:Uncharacterized protein n=1 Tax=Ensete ventricosum TaxID=4639 RepID=A0AAV8REV2_ENSVE|nr:hypothetical protein OPV22_004649 [Ensete ventricosum]
MASKGKDKIIVAEYKRKTSQHQFYLVSLYRVIEYRRQQRTLSLPPTPPLSPQIFLLSGKSKWRRLLRDLLRRPIAAASLDLLQIDRSRRGEET